MPKSNIFIISGPSGAGEDSIINGLKKHFQFERIITTTTRSMREDDIDGETYYFITKDEFLAKINAGNFAEYAEHYNGNFYGVTKKELQRVQNSGKIGLLKVEYKGVVSIKKIFPEIKAIFVNASSLEILEKRIRNRDKVSEEYLSQRMSYTKEWLNHLDMYDYKVINEEGKLCETIEKVAEIIKLNLKNNN